MDFLRQTFLEQPFLVYLTSGMAELVTVAIYNKTRAPRARLMLMLWPVLAIAVGLLAAAVETDHEKVRVAWDDVEVAIAESDVARLMSRVSDRFSVTRLNKDDLRDLAEEAGRRLPDGMLGFRNFNVEEAEAGQMTIGITAVCRPLQVSRWHVVFVCDPDGRWRMLSAECVKPRSLNLRQAVAALKAMTNR
jgi:predicted protein tyrosine phosphatase